MRQVVSPDLFFNLKISNFQKRFDRGWVFLMCGLASRVQCVDKHPEQTMGRHTVDTMRQPVAWSEISLARHRHVHVCKVQGGGFLGVAHRFPVRFGAGLIMAVQ